MLKIPSFLISSPSLKFTIFLFYPAILFQNHVAEELQGRLYPFSPMQSLYMSFQSLLRI